MCARRVLKETSVSWVGTDVAWTPLVRTRFSSNFYLFLPKSMSRFSKTEGFGDRILFSITEYHSFQTDEERVYTHTLIPTS